MTIMTLAETAPIACTLNAAEFRSRRSKLADLNRAALKSHRRDDLRLELLYALEARARVVEMVKAEQACCAFLTFAIREEPGALRVFVEAPERARERSVCLSKALCAAAPGEKSCGCKSASASTDRVVGASAAL